MGNEFKWLNHILGEGAYSAFEKICLDIFSEKYNEATVERVNAKNGDGGIDVYIKKNGKNRIIVIQCKFNIDGIGNSQKGNIRSSFKRVLSEEAQKLKKWILCVPVTLTNEEIKWWDTWKDKQVEEFKELYGKNLDIELYSEEKIISLLKKYNLYQKHFGEMYKTEITPAIIEDRLFAIIHELNGLDCDFLEVIEKIEDFKQYKNKIWFRNNNVLENLDTIAHYLALAGPINIVKNQEHEKSINDLLGEAYIQAKNIEW